MKPGDLFWLETDDVEPVVENGPYILGIVDYNTCCLVNMQTGRYFCNPVKVGNPSSITDTEFDSLKNGSPFRAY